jgi:hypothetical protein
MTQIIPTPKHKKDWPGQFLLLGKPYPEGRVTAPVVRIVRRKNAMDTQNCPHDVSHWGSVRILAVEWRCHACGAAHSGYLPESLIEPGIAYFVKLENK